MAKRILVELPKGTFPNRWQRLVFSFKRKPTAAETDAWYAAGCPR